MTVYKDLIVFVSHYSKVFWIIVHQKACHSSGLLNSRGYNISSSCGRALWVSELARAVWNTRVELTNLHGSSGTGWPKKLAATKW